MSTYLALDEVTNDIMLDPDGGLIRIDSGARRTVQHVRSRLQTMRGEYKGDSSAGWIKLEDLGKSAEDGFDIETRAAQIILDTEGVTELTSLYMIPEADRKSSLIFVAQTKYGAIYETLPWGIGE